MLQASLILACLLSIASCTPTWKHINSKDVSASLNNITLHIPYNWVLFNGHHNNYLARINGREAEIKINRIILTKNGFFLDLIKVTMFDLDKAFPSIEQSADNSLLPSELAELWIAEQIAMRGLGKINISKNEPRNIDNLDGFLVKSSFNDKKGNEISSLTYGLTTKNHFYTFTYQAPSLHFFDSSLTDFQKLIDSISIES